MNMGVHVRLSLVALAAVMIGLFLMACGSSATSAPASQTEAPKEVFKLKFTSPVAPPPFLLRKCLKSDLCYQREIVVKVLILVHE